jgi:hypothetical protein
MEQSIALGARKARLPPLSLVSRHWSSPRAPASTPLKIRGRVCEDAAWLGIEVDQSANTAGGPYITRSSSRVSDWIIPTVEDLMIARHSWDVLLEIADRTKA